MFSWRLKLTLRHFPLKFASFGGLVLASPFIFMYLSKLPAPADPSWPWVCSQSCPPPFWKRECWLPLHLWRRPCRPACLPASLPTVLVCPEVSSLLPSCTFPFSPAKVLTPESRSPVTGARPICPSARYLPLLSGHPGLTPHVQKQNSW